MKQTCHIKTVNTFSLLRRDHYNGLWVVSAIRNHIRNQVKNEELVAYIKQAFFNHLEPHLIEEEMLLFPQLPPNDLLRIEAEEQHVKLHHLAERCLSAAITSTVIAEEFANQLEENIRFEERTFFPYFRKMEAEKKITMN